MPGWKTPSGARLGRWLGSPAGLLAAALLAAAVLAALPSGWIAPARDAADAALRPGRRAALALRGATETAVRRARSHFQTADRLAEAERDLARLQAENARLAAELAVVRATSVQATRYEDRDDRLLRARSVPARVLGSQARAYLARRELLDVGSLDGVAPDALVVEPVALLDQGDDAALVAGQLVLAGRRVWGKVSEVGRHCSAVQTVRAAGFRDLVELVDPDRASSRGAHRPRGVLEGTGEPLARVRRVEVTEPVAVGDLVCAVSAAGVVAEPLVYGRVVRVEQPVGAAFWEIWMEPAVVGQPAEVAVLRVEANAARLAEKQGLGIGD